MLKIIKKQSKYILLFSVVLLIGFIMSGCDGGSPVDNKYSLTISIEGGGSVNPTAGKHDFEKGTIITLEITPDKNYEFKEWSGTNSDEILYNENEDKYTLLMNSDKEIISVFTDKENTDFKTIIAIEELEEINVEYSTLFKDLNLPENVEVTLDDDSKENIAVTWNEEDYNSEKLQKQTITGELTDLPENIINPYNLTAVANVVQEDNTNAIDVNPEMVLVEAGKAASSNGSVTINKDYYISQYQVTQADFEKVMRFNPSYFNDENNPNITDDSGNRPVEHITFYDAAMYANKLSKAKDLEKYYNISDIEYDGDNIIDATITENTNAKGYRLPTGIEHEYAACGGKESKITTYAGSDDLDVVGWYKDNAEGKTHQVGKKEANELGLYDMSGNVHEWTNTSSGSYHLVVGGSWFYGANYCEIGGSVLSRNASNKGSIIGFRLARSTAK